eukprot:537121-Prorocentrum_minimum.AAC.1
MWGRDWLGSADVDDIHEYLLLKGVEAVAIHGGMDQEEREHSIDTFKAGQKDVLVATDVASKVSRNDQKRPSMTKNKKNDCRTAEAACVRANP